VTRDRALDRVTKLLALAGPTSGATDEERRTAAVEAVRLMAEHASSPERRPPSTSTTWRR
jgi:hypothetical protein